MVSSIRFLSLNVRMKNYLAGLQNLIFQFKLDIILIQEIRLTDEDLSNMMRGLGYKCNVNIDVDEPSRPGTAMIWNEALPINNVENLHECRAQIAFLNHDAILNVHAPSGAKKRVVGI